MSVTLGDKCASYYTVKNMVAMLRRGHLSTEDEHSGRPAPGNVYAIHCIIMDDQISAKKRRP